MTITDFLQRRFDALSAKDFRAVYQTYHEEAPFRVQFSNSEEYCAFASQYLTDIVVESWRVIDQRALSDEQVECLLAMELKTPDGASLFFENALLIQTDQGWTYHSAQKLDGKDGVTALDRIGFEDFDRVTEKIRL